MASSRNATFLFYRGFMDYHKDRFEDHSVMVYRDEKLFALLPANTHEDRVISHQGLTYGSFILQESAKLLDVAEAFKSLLKFLNDKGILYLELRLIPSFYCKIPSDEIQYCLYHAGAELIKRDAIMLIDFRHELGFQKNRREGINKAVRNGLEVMEDGDLEAFWNKILIPNLKNKHEAEPVHSLEEITKLTTTFPDKIKQVNVYKDGKIVAGTTVFLTETTVHPQYVSANTEKNAYGSLDLLYDFVIRQFREGRRYFDFSTSSEEDGKVLNKGLLFWKETCGARTYTSDNYLLSTASYKEFNLQLK